MSRWTFGPDDESEFQAAKGELVDRFRTWRRTTPDAVSDAELALDWKWGYDDGDLVTWTTEHLAELLFSWFPRKVTMPPGQAAPTVASLRSFLAFLAEERLLGGGSSSLRSLDQFLASSVGRFSSAMADISRFGMGKSLFAGMAAHGFGSEELTPESAAAMMAAFNDLSFEERGRILGLDRMGGGWRDPWEQLTDGVELGPAEPMEPGPLTAAIDAVPIMQQIDGIRRFVGKEHKLTATGNLPVADARALAEQLGLDDWALDTEHRPGKRQLRSASDLPATQFALRWARAAGATRVARVRLSATASWGRLDRVAAFVRTATAILDKGPIQLRHADNRWTAVALDQVVDEGVAPLLAMLWAVDELEVDELVDVVDEIADLLLAWTPVMTPELRRRRVRRSVETLFAVTAMAGLTRLEGEQVVATAHGTEDRSGGMLSLTPLARATLGPWLTAHGFTVPEVGGLVDGPLSSVFERIGEWHTDRVSAEFAMWARAHGADPTIEAVRALLRPGCDPLWRIAAVDLVSSIGAEPGGEPNEAAVRRLLDTAGRAQAINWLVTNGSDDVPDDPQAMLQAGVELLAAQLDPDPDDDNELFVSFITMIDPIGELIDSMWRIREPHVGDVLAAIGRLHPDARQAKAARKALIRHRSHMANLR